MTQKTFQEKLQTVLKYPEMIEAIADVMQAGIDKGYEPEDWLKPDGKKQSLKENFDSMSHHNALIFSGEFIDKESGLDHGKHLATRALMGVVRRARGIVHPDDQEKVNKISGIVTYDPTGLLDTDFKGCSKTHCLCKRAGIKNET
jgi:hypothetical protein